jgi:hypothetical protein
MTYNKFQKQNLNRLLMKYADQGLNKPKENSVVLDFEM